MAFIYKEKKPGTWYVDHTPPGGKRVRERVGKHKRAAELRLVQIEHDLSFNRAGITKRQATVAELFREYEQSIAHTLRENTVKRYREVMQHFRIFLGDRFETLRLASVDVRLFDQYITWRRDGNSDFDHRAPKSGDCPKAKNGQHRVRHPGHDFQQGQGVEDDR